MRFVFAFLVVLFVTAASKQIYKGDKVLQFNLTSQAQFKTVQNLEKNQHLDIWSQKGLSYFETRIPKNSFQHVNEILFKKFNIKFRTIVSDVQELVDKELLEMKTRIQYDPKNKKSGEEFFKNFRTIEEIHAWMKNHAENSNLVDIVSAGKTYEGREILGMRIKGQENKPISVHHGAMHAREVSKYSFKI